MKKLFLSACRVLLSVSQAADFVNAGGSIVTVGSSTVMAEIFGLPYSDYLVEKAPGAPDKPLVREKLYIPGSLMRADVDITNPLAYGMPRQADIFFDSSPTFKLPPSASSQGTSAVAWYGGPHTLTSGWAWGEEYLNGGVAVAASKLGKGSVVIRGPEVSFRGEPHGTFKLLFKGLFYGGPQPVMEDCSR